MHGKYRIEEERGMKKGQEYIGKIEELEFPNKGIFIYREGDTETRVTIKGTLPGQTVRFFVSKYSQCFRST